MCSKPTWNMSVVWLFKRNRFSNISVEMKDDIWSVYFANVQKFEFIERSNLKFKQYHIVKHLKTLFGYSNTLDYQWRITGADLDNIIPKIVHKDHEYSKIFGVSSTREKTNDIDRKKGLKIINKYLTAWGVNKIIRLKKVRKQVNKIRVECPDLYEYGFDTSLNLTYQEPNDKCSIIEED